MNKILRKTVKKFPLMTLVMAVVVLVTFLVTLFAGVNYDATNHSVKTLTVTGGYFSDAEVSDIENICEATFDDFGLNAAYELETERNGADSEIKFVFKSTTSKLGDVKTALETAFADKTKAGGEWEGSFVYVTVASEDAGRPIAWSYMFSAAGAIVLFAILMFVYVALRFKISMAIYATLGMLFGAGCSTVLVLLCRLPITVSTFYAIVLSALITGVFMILNCNKLRNDLKSEEYAEKPADEVIADSVAYKEILGFTISLSVVLVLVGAIATLSTLWFALTALVSLIASAFVALFYAPALYYPIKKFTDKKFVRKSDYKGAQKTSTKEKFKALFQKKKAQPAAEAPKATEEIPEAAETAREEDQAE